MSKDDENPVPPADDALVDRDDIDDIGGVDRDYDDDFPGHGRGEEGAESSSVPDPGFAAFADELDDPLADWPSPDRPLQDLPEMRAQADPTAFGESSPTGGFAPESNAPIFEKPGFDTPGLDTPGFDEPDLDVPGYDVPGYELPGFDAPEAAQPEAIADSGGEAFFADDVEEDDPGPLAYFDDEVEEMDAAPASAEAMHGDRDEQDSTSGLADLDALSPAQETRFLEEPLEKPPYDDDTSGPEEFVDALDLGSSRGAIPDLVPPPLSISDDVFVDDFLNDLDPPESEGAALEADKGNDPPADPAGTGARETPPLDYAGDGGLMPPAAPLHIDEQRPSSIESAAMPAALHSDFAEEEPAEEEPAEEEPAEAPAAAVDDVPAERPARRLPIVTIGVLCVALILLAVGGYGVLQQRGEMQAEIRELRAQLATTITPEEAATERERQRQVELENESLNAELEGLTAENRELGDRLSSMETTLAAREAEAARASAESARLAQQVKQQASQPRTPASSATGAQVSVSAGTWFVNFGSYAQRNVADRWAAQLDVESGTVGVQTATAAGKTLYRVRVLGLPDRDTAERIATGLERKYQLPRLWVGKSD